VCSISFFALDVPVPNLLLFAQVEFAEAAACCCAIIRALLIAASWCICNKNRASSTSILSMHTMPSAGRRIADRFWVLSGIGIWPPFGASHQLGAFGASL
jgi:hypothetical protein